MNDLLTDSFVSDTKDAPRGRDIEMGMQAARNNSDLGMEAFNKQIQEIDKQVDKVSGLLKKLKDANEESKSVTKASDMKGLIFFLPLTHTFKFSLSYTRLSSLLHKHNWQTDYSFPAMMHRRGLFSISYSELCLDKTCAAKIWT